MNAKHPHLDRILRVIDYIHTHADEDLSLDQLADVAAMSRFHWHRVFSAVLGGPPGAIIRSVRLHKASMLLVPSDLPIPDVAARVGYPNHRRFARAFKDIYAQTPSTFRRMGKAARAPFPKPGDKTMYDVSIKTIDDLEVAAILRRGAYEGINAAFQKISGILSTGGHWPQTRGMVGVYYDDPSSVPEAELKSHAGVIWTGGKMPEGLEKVTLAGGKYAVLRLKGPYTGLMPAHQYLYGAWLAETQESLRDAPSFEVNVNDPSDTAPADLITDIHMPLEG